jgi:hypothetical protein
MHVCDVWMCAQVFTNDLPALVDGISDVASDLMKATCDGLYFTYATIKNIGAI